jgi:hypothetical protein
MSSIDWKTELRKIEREFDGLPPEPTAAELRAHRVLNQEPADEITPFGVWARLLFVAALAAALPFWPYARYCGTGLFGYMGAGAMIAVGGLWVSVGSWRCRTAFAHFLSILLIILGIGVVGHQILPRVGYARTDPANPPQWWCPSTARR